MKTQQTRPTHYWPEVEIIFDNEIGRVVTVSGYRGSSIDPYYVAHAWDNEEHTASEVVGYYRSKAEAIRALEDL